MNRVHLSPCGERLLYFSLLVDKAILEDPKIENGHKKHTTQDIPQGNRDEVIDKSPDTHDPKPSVGQRRQGHDL